VWRANEAARFTKSVGAFLSHLVVPDAHTFALPGIVTGRNDMTTKEAVVRRAAGAALALALALVVVGSVAAATLRDRTPPTTPTNLRVTSLSHKTVTVAWDPSTDSSGSISYTVYKDGQAFTVLQGRTTYTIDWLSPGLTYSFYVTASDKALNQSGKSNTITVTTPRDTTPPTAPQLSGSVRGPSQVSLTWTQSTDDLSTLVGYRIFANGAQVTEHVNWWGERTVVLRHLTQATSYAFTIQASDSDGNTATSNAVTLTTEATSDVTPPSAPTNVRIVEDPICAEVWLGWTQSTDDTDPQHAIEYEIYVNGVLSPLPVGAGIDRDFVYGTANGENTFTVKAVDRAGNTSEASNAVTAVLWPC
jgi:fibronectin type 3 domain-containing protein